MKKVRLKAMVQFLFSTLLDKLLIHCICAILLFRIPGVEIEHGKRNTNSLCYYTRVTQTC